MGPIAQVEVVSFWPTSPAHVQPVQELAPPPASFWPIAHFPFDFSPNPPYNPPYAPLRSSRSSPHAGHGVSYRSASRTPSTSSGAEASEAQPSRRERTQDRRQAAPSTPPQRSHEPPRDSYRPVPRVPPQPGSGRSQHPTRHACSSTVGVGEPPCRARARRAGVRGPFRWGRGRAGGVRVVPPGAGATCGRRARGWRRCALRAAPEARAGASGRAPDFGAVRAVAGLRAGIVARRAVAVAQSQRGARGRRAAQRPRRTKREPMASEAAPASRWAMDARLTARCDA